MADLIIRTAAGNRNVSPDRLQHLLAEGKIRPEQQLVSIDGGVTFISVAQALKAVAAPPPLANHGNHAPPPPLPPVAPVGAPVLMGIPVGTMPIPQAAPVQVPPLQMGLMSPMVILIIAGAAVLFCLMPQFYVSLSHKNPGGTESVGSGWNFGWKVWWAVVALMAGLLALQAVVFEIILRGNQAVAKLARWFYLSAFGAMTLISLVGIILGFMGTDLRFSINPSGDTFRSRRVINSIPVNTYVDNMSDRDRESKVSVTCIPIGTALVLLASGSGLTLSLMSIIRKSRTGGAPFLPGTVP